MLKLNTNQSLPLLNHSIQEIHQQLKSGKLNPLELYEICRKRIEKTKILNAFITISNDLALEQASNSNQRYSQGKSLGLLDGLPISIKDNFNTKNLRTTCASKMLENYQPPFNATVVEKLFNSGVICMGKTNMDEFAMGSACSESYFGPSYHPWNSNLNFCYQFNSNDCDKNLINSKLNEDKNQWFITGGSSGGSAVSVATGSVFASISSDTGGSTRNPASRLGIVGFKPSYGIISRFGLIPLTHSLDVPGIMARNVEDVHIIFSHLIGHDHRDSTTVNIQLKDDDINFENLTIGIPEEYYCPNLNPDICQAWEDAQKLLSKNGLKIRKISLPHTKYSLPCYSILNTSEVASNFACYDGIEYGFGHKNLSDASQQTFEDYYSSTRESALNDIVKSRIISGNYFLLKENYRKYFEKALKIRRLITTDFDKIFSNDIDFILTPVCITSTMNYQKWLQMDRTVEAIQEDYCTQPANMAGIPAITIPFKLDSNNHNLPIGLQILSKKFDDLKLLKFSKRFQSMIQFPNMILLEQNEQ